MCQSNLEMSGSGNLEMSGIFFPAFVLEARSSTFFFGEQCNDPDMRKGQGFERAEGASLEAFTYLDTLKSQERLSFKNPTKPLVGPYVDLRHSSAESCP